MSKIVLHWQLLWPALTSNCCRDWIVFSTSIAQAPQFQAAAGSDINGYFVQRAIIPVQNSCSNFCRWGIDMNGNSGKKN